MVKNHAGCRNRFLILLSFLHATDNQSPDAETDKLHKIKKLSELLVTNWQKYCYPGREIYVYVTLVPFKGRTKL